MILDAGRGDRTGFAQGFDVCVIGAGPAGITLALRLAAAGAKVALMEAGGLEISAESQDAYAGAVVGRDYYPLDTARLRFLGGSSNHWGGMCRPLDASDFAAHSWLPGSGWPIGRADLDRYAAEAGAILELGDPVAEVAEDESPGDLAGGPQAPTLAPILAPDRESAGFPDEPIVQAAPRLRHVSFRFSPPVRFGEKYRAALEAAPGLLVGLNANLVDLRLGDGGSGADSGAESGDESAVVAARFRGYDPADPGFAVRARFYALCTGGLENPRLLLAFRSQRPEGIGNRGDLVGRFFCEHPSFAAAEVLYERQRPAGYETYAPMPAFLEQQAMMNVGLWLHADGPPPAPGLARETLRRAACSADFLAALAGRVLGRAPRCGPAPAPATGQIRLASEQALDRDSRLRLGEARDAFGLPRPELDWRLGERDFHTMRAGTTALGMHLAEQGIGRARMLDWLQAEAPEIPAPGEDQVASWHHMCTTRMADDPRHGVVDRDGRVHEVDNLYLGGSSVFATAGFANPTYTIVQLSLRLGDHLAGRLAG